MKIKNIKLVNQLESYYGIGRTQSKAICNLLGISPLLKMNQLTRYEKVKIRSFMRKRNKIIENPLSSISSMYSQNRSNRKMWMLLPINDNLKFLEKNNRLSLINKNCYRGSRAKKGLPIRGQRTRSNAQTCRRMIRFWKNIK